MPDPLRVCLLLPGETVPAWQAAAIRRAADLEGCEVTLTVVDESSSSRSRSPVDAVRRAAELREWGLVGGALALRRRIVGPTPHERPVPIDSIDAVAGSDRVDCSPITVDGWKNRLPDEVVDRIAAEADVAVRFGFGFLVGDALTEPEHGVLSYHHGDLREYRGQPMGFWEFVHGRETAGVTLQRLNETLDGGEIVADATVDIGDAARWGEVKARLFDASPALLAEGLRNVRDDDHEPARPDELGELYTLPKGRPVLRYLDRTVRGVVRSSIGSALAGTSH